MRYRFSLPSCAVLSLAASIACAQSRDQSGDIAAPFGGAELAAAEDFVATRSGPSPFDTSRLVAQVRNTPPRGERGYDVNADGGADIAADARAVAAARARANADVGLAPAEDGAQLARDDRDDVPETARAEREALPEAVHRNLDDAVLANLDASTPVDEGQIKVTARKDGTVVLNGTVESEAQKKLIEAVAANTPAVAEVRNRIVVRDMPGGPEERVPAEESRIN